MIVEEAEAAQWRADELEAALRHSAVGLSVGGDGVEAARRQREERAAEYNPNDVRCRGGFAELRQCHFLCILEAKKAGLVTFSIDAPWGHFRALFEQHGALVASAPAGGSVADAWNVEREAAGA